MVKKVKFVHLLLYSSEAGFPLLVCKKMLVIPVSIHQYMCFSSQYFTFDQRRFDPVTDHRINSCCYCCMKYCFNAFGKLFWITTPLVSTIQYAIPLVQRRRRLFCSGMQYQRWVAVPTSMVTVVWKILHKIFCLICIATCCRDRFSHKFCLN